MQKTVGMYKKEREWRSLTRLTIILLNLLFVSGCGESRETSVSGSSVSDLLKKLPNLKCFGIQSCNYTVKTSTIRGRLEVPAPSDTQLTLKGSVVLSEDGFKELTSKFNWKSVERQDVPDSLLEVLPPGHVMVSQKLNESFSQNPTYWYGFVARLTSDNSKRIYLVANDLDHPIK